MKTCKLSGGRARRTWSESLLQGHLPLIVPLCPPTPIPCSWTHHAWCASGGTKPSSFDSGPCHTCPFILNTWHAVALNHLPVPRLLPCGQPWQSFCLLLLPLNPTLPLLLYVLLLFSFTSNSCGCVATFYAERD